ncbi:helix-turn-helix domain-containing protein [Gordonia sp. ABSL1-1]|uniref:PucR family transcriptional regulator n=1 Tax=Gordonia sp. ABSL1-1 TaxID=3053923 RepID=UPI0025739804|nr:helix-turn-helix domain-containing protein [Gordonia sp. ABSL1-1]MDL9938610.1 helix-turn-helix domain-containing protein [Gordonia sp. ABSL1-1]
MASRSESARLQRVGARLLTRTEPIATRILEHVEATRPDLGSDAESGLHALMAMVITSNVDNVITAMSQATPIDAVPTTIANEEFARRLAERDVSASEVVQLHQLAHHQLILALLDEITGPGDGDGNGDGNGDDPDPPATIRAVVDYANRYNAAATEAAVAAVAAYTQRHTQWFSARRVDLVRRVRAVLAGHEGAEVLRRLGCEPDRRHVGIVVWAPTTVPDIEAPAERLSQLPGALVVPVDGATIHAWVRADDEPSAQLWQDVGARDPGLRIALGAPATGVDGFRATHAQALATQEMVEKSARPDPAVVAYRDVAPISFLARDPAAAARWASAVLGDLDGPGADLDELRLTLATYLDSGQNTGQTAETLYVHRNTVTYRLARIRELLPRDARHHGRLNLALALAYRHWFP